MYLIIHRLLTRNGWFIVRWLDICVSRNCYARSIKPCGKLQQPVLKITVEILQTR